MNRLTRQLTEVLGPGMAVPEELDRLYGWIETHATVTDHEGFLSGFLDVPDDSGYATNIEFRADGTDCLEHWFGTDDRAVLDRVCVFAQTGGDGSMAALWIDDDGRQRIVHMGSGSGSTAVCVLGETPLDFLRLVAIGYDELCWSREWSGPPTFDEIDGETPRDPDCAYRRWLLAEFDTTIPERALDLVTLAEMEDEDPSDPFARWLTTIDA
ncbi:SMI1/KNR4 family protein [Stackebrandtia soli]|uniref:SMI1/KNR4 family protein n=1 Tax=Stackebrandtia soli TaxID=1892856 RepID=UPI0039E949EE